MPSHSDGTVAEEAGSVAEVGSFTENVLAVVDAIPPGRVMTYGEVAAVLGSRAARRVGQILAHYGATVPWWRVVRASGQPAAGHENIALERYREEGTPLSGNPHDEGTTTTYRVDLSTARHRPR